MKKIVIIPARMGSSRFPGKPMKKICGIPMIGHVWNRCKLSQSIEEVYVATCDVEIAAYIKAIGGNVIMTSNKHERASDRCAEALLSIEAERKYKIDVIVMVQGDEPLTRPEMIDESLIPFQDPQISVVNLLGEITSEDEFQDPNCIKVVTDFNGYAIYFSRSPIPYHKKWHSNSCAHKQVCIIPFTREMLLKFQDLHSVESEIQESIDMLRLLEHGYKVKMIPKQFSVKAVDTPEDLAAVEKIMKDDIFFKKYSAV